MSDEVLGKDISLKDSNDVKFSSNQDFDFIHYRNNLQQAIANRLRTAKGEYSNTEYGSELHKCIGQPINDILKNRIIGYVVETLKQEPRVTSIKSIDVTFDESDNTKVNLSLVVNVIDSQTPLNMIYPLFLT